MVEDSQEQYSHELKHLKSAALAVALTYTGLNETKIEKYTDNLNEKLKESIDQIIDKPIPFYKGGDSGPAGYVIETNDEVLVCYHGTQFDKAFGVGFKEIVHDLLIGGSKMIFGGNKVLVHDGFKREFMASKDSMNDALSQIQDKTKGVHLSGHSLGAAVAQIAAMDLSINENVKVNRVTTFGGPRVFQKKAADLYNSKGLGDRTFRVKQYKDPITRLVPRGLYFHVGKKVNISSSKDLVHLLSSYIGIINNMTENDVNNAKSSDIPWSFKELYLNPVMKMTKENFAKIQNVRMKVDKIRTEVYGYVKSKPGEAKSTFYRRNDSKGRSI